MEHKLKMRLSTWWLVADKLFYTTGLSTENALKTKSKTLRYRSLHWTEVYVRFISRSMLFLTSKCNKMCLVAGLSQTSGC